MAINYTNLFEDVGEFLERINDFLTLADTTLPAYATEVHAGLTSNARYDVLSGTPEIFEGFQDGAVGWIGQMTGKIEERLVNRTTVAEELPLDADPEIFDVLKELYRDMVSNSEDINASIVAIGAVSTNLIGDTDGTILTDNKLDGFNPPISGGETNDFWVQDLDEAAGAGRFPGEAAAYEGEPSQLGKNETMTLTCTLDSEKGRSSEGSEQFEWVGAPEYGSYDWKGEGSGNGPTMTVMNGAGLITNGEFESWTVADTPDSWDVDSGTVSTHISEETINVKRGSSALKLTGDGAEATIQISQDLTGLDPGRRYVLGCWVEGEAATASGALAILLAGTGYTPGTNEQISMNAAALSAQTTFAVEYFFFNVPLEVPTDFELVIKVTGTLTSAKSVYIDGLSLASAIYHGGICIGILAGENKFLQGDRFTFAVTNDGVGVFQEFFRRHFNFQMPSVTDGSETIPDSLASD